MIPTVGVTGAQPRPPGGHSAQQLQRAGACTHRGHVSRQSQADRKLGRLGERVTDAVTQGWDATPCTLPPRQPPFVICSPSCSFPASPLSPLPRTTQAPGRGVARGLHTLCLHWAQGLLRHPVWSTINFLPYKCAS